MSNNSCAPMCVCGQDSVYIDNGPRLQYYYCRSCKVEVGLQEVAKQTVPDAALQGLSAWLPSSSTNAPRFWGGGSGRPLPAQPAQTMYLVVAVDYQRGEVHITEHPQAKGSPWTVDFTNFSGNGVPNPGNVLHGFSFARPAPVPTPAPLSHHFDFRHPYSLRKTCTYCGIDELAVTGGYASNACGGQQQASISQQPAPLSKVSPLAVDHMMDAYRYWAASIKEKEWD